MKTRFVLGLLILLAAAAALYLGPSICKFLGGCPEPLTEVKGEIGGSKEGLFLDPAVQQILKDKYYLTVSYKTVGGSGQVCPALPPGSSRDFVWPGNEIAVEEYKACHGGKAGMGAEYVLISPIVFYSWADITDALAAQGLVHDEDGVYYLDMRSFVPMLMEGRPWSSLGVPPEKVNRSINVEPTDPANSNSGQVWAALLATMLNDGQVPNAESIGPLMPQVKAYFGRQGFMQLKSIDLFNRYITVGQGDKPIIVEYESLLPDYVFKHETDAKKGCAVLENKPVRVIYPRPTVWASHPLIAETPNGVKLQKALLDPEIQKLAWEKHGFRAPLGNVPNTLLANCLKAPASIGSTVPLPNASVMDTLINYIKSTPTPASTPAAKR